MRPTVLSHLGPDGATAISREIFSGVPEASSPSPRLGTVRHVSPSNTGRWKRPEVWVRYRSRCQPLSSRC